MAEEMKHLPVAVGQQLVALADKSLPRVTLTLPGAREFIAEQHMLYDIPKIGPVLTQCDTQLIKLRDMCFEWWQSTVIFLHILVSSLSRASEPCPALI